MIHWIDSHAPGGAHLSGDFVDCMHLADERYALIVGDIAGRGADVGHAAAALRSVLRDLVLSRLPLATTVCAVDKLFKKTMLKDSTPFASIFVAAIDPWRGVMRYVSAGHEPAILFKMDGSHVHLGPTGPILGVGAFPTFEECVVRPAPDDVLVVVTDGVTEARRYAGGRLDFFGSSGVVSAVNGALRRGDDPARAICDAALDHANGRRYDDASAIVLRLPERRRPGAIALPGRFALPDRDAAVEIA